MTQDVDTTTSESARGALASVRAMRRAGARLAAPPRWFALLTALVVGLHVGGEGLWGGYLQYTVIASGIGLMVIYFIAAAGRARPGLRPATSLGLQVASLCMAIAGFGIILLYVAAFAARVRFGAGWAAWPIGAAAGMLTYGAFELARGVLMWTALRRRR